ncbi:MAG: hypothetical protein JRJ43_10340 [Deltaproteobacteria bacterium]|nr:hypothetical protein [Deltaproteobacteria bacterium]
MKYNILIEDKSQDDLIEEGVLSSIRPFFFHEQTIDDPIRNLSLEEKVDGVVGFLVGTSRDIRKGPKPTKGVIESIKSNVKSYIEENKPFKVVAAFGCAKTRALEQQGIDLAELMIIEQLASISQRVRKFYEPGLNYQVFLCDSWYLHLYGLNDQAAVEKYCSEFELLISILDLKEFQVQKLSNIVQNKGKDHQIAQKIEHNFELLEAYWEESKDHTEKEWESLTSYKKLCQAGWIGTLPRIQREFYLKKVQRYLPGANSREERDAVLRYFAYSLMTGQEDLFGRSTSVADISFLSPPPGSPKRLRGNRLHWRSMPKGTSNKLPASWTSKGFLLHKGKSFKPTAMSVQEYLANEYELLRDATLELANESKQIKIPIPIYSHPV